MNIKERIEHYKNDHLVKLEISWKKRMAIVLHFLFAYFFSYSSDVEAMLVTANGGYEKVMRSNLAAVQSLDIETFYLTIEQMAEILSRCDPNKLIKLKIEIGLGGCLKFQTLPENMRNFQNLLEIDLYKSGIKKELPEWMGDFRFLQKLLLPCGPFVDEKMPLWMFNLRNLITLDISTRGLKIIPDLISNFSKLRSLNLSGNYIEKLPAEISCLTKLEELDLSYNFFLEDLPDEMNMLVNLKFINISNTGMRKKVPDCISHVPQIKK